MIEIGIGEFKAKCLKLMDFAGQKHESIIITKRGARIAKIVPYKSVAPALFGFMENSVKVKGDILEPIETTWDAEKA